jgi:hypothetical protein
MRRKTNSIKLEVSNGNNIANNNISSQKIKLSVRIKYAVNLVSEDDLQKVSRKTLEALSEYLIGKFLFTDLHQIREGIEALN